MSISAPRGDAGQTSLPVDARVSQSDVRVEVFGTIDELISSMGLTRALCSDPAIQELTASIQSELLVVRSILSGMSGSRKEPSQCIDESVRRLAAEVHRIEGTNNEAPFVPDVLRYLNRLSDLLWWFGRLIEVGHSVNSRRPEPGDFNPRWSRE